VFLPLAEAYTVVLWVLNGLKPGEVIDEATCVTKAIKEGRFAYLLRRITSESSIAKTLFENGFKLAENMRLTGETTAETAAARKLLLREFRDLCRRMEVSRIEGLRSADRIFDEGE
jgi:glycerol-3-phosphate O-acyltransferase